MGLTPGKFSRGGNASCVFCGTVATSDYVKKEGQAKRMDKQLMAVVCTKEKQRGKIYLSADDVPEDLIPDEKEIWRRIEKLCEETGLSVPEEPLIDKSADQLPMYGMPSYGDMFTPRQLLALLTFTKWVRKAEEEMWDLYRDDIVKAILLYMGIIINKMARFNCMFSRIVPTKDYIVDIFGRQAIPMTWDFPELNFFHNEETPD